MTRTPGVGAFLNVVQDDPDDWGAQMDRLAVLDGLHHVEVWLEAIDGELLGELPGLLAGRETIMHGPFIGLSLVSPWAELRAISIARLACAAEIGAGFGARVMTVHPGIACFAEDEAVLEDRLVDSLRRLRARIDGTLTVAIENMPCRRGASVDGLVTVDQCARLIDRDPDTRITLDVGHAIQNDDKYLPFLAEHTDAVADIHLHDGAAGGGAHWPLGAGELDLPELTACLVDTAYAGYLTLETLGWEDTRSSYGAAISALRVADGAA